MSVPLLWSIDKPFADLQTANNNEQGHELSSPPAYSEHSFNSSPAYTAHSGLYQQEGAVPKDPPPPYTNIGIVDSHAHPTLQPLIVGCMVHSGHGVS